MIHDDELPQEILIDIFSKLPAKSVGKCRCLSRTWRSLLSSPEFVKSHLSKIPLQQTLILISSTHSICSISPNHNASRTLQLGDNWAAFVGSINGLVLLLSNEEEDVFLANPTTLQQVKIPDSPLALKRGESFRMHGFGYDSCSDDYKIVTLSYYNTDNEYEPDCADTFVDVYSVKMGVWRRAGTSPYDHAVPDLSSGAYANGCLHWLASSRSLGYPSVIAAFDLTREVFNEMPAPDGVDVEKFVFNQLAVLGGCLCMFDVKTSGRTDVWIMTEYGSGDSWTKFSIDAGNDRWDVIKPLCFVGDKDDVVLVTDEDSLVVYDRETETFRDMVVDQVPAMFIGGGTHVESLVSPTFG